MKDNLTYLYLGLGVAVVGVIIAFVVIVPGLQSNSDELVASSEEAAMIQSNSEIGQNDMDSGLLTQSGESVGLRETNMDNTQDNANSDSSTSEKYSQASTIDYSPGIIESQPADANIVLFFAADWCLTCQGLKSSLAAEFSNYPADLVIIEADYDDELQLRQQYGVTLQHTLVQVDNSGTELTKWSGGGDLESVLQKLV